MMCLYRIINFGPPTRQSPKGRGGLSRTMSGGSMSQSESQVLRKVNDTDSQCRNIRQPDGQDIYLLAFPRLCQRNKQAQNLSEGTRKVYFFCLFQHTCALQAGSGSAAHLHSGIQAEGAAPPQDGAFSSPQEGRLAEAQWLIKLWLRSGTLHVPSHPVSQAGHLVNPPPV